MANNSRDTALKVTIVIVLTIIALVLLYNLLLGGGANIGLNAYGQGNNFNDIVAFTLVIAVKMLWIVFLISLGIGLVMALKKYLLQDKRTGPTVTGAVNGTGYTCPCCGAALTAEFRFCPNCKASLKDVCGKCGKELQLGWLSCPWCGQRRH